MPCVPSQSVLRIRKPEHLDRAPHQARKDEPCTDEDCSQELGEKLACWYPVNTSKCFSLWLFTQNKSLEQTEFANTSLKSVGGSWNLCEAERVVSSKERLWRVSPRPSMTLSSQVTLGSSVPAGCHTAALVLSATKMCNSGGCPKGVSMQ